jgi:hypothetical protein
MSYKSRNHWPIGICLVECANKGTKKCKICVRYSELKKKARSNARNR